MALSAAAQLVAHSSILACLAFLDLGFYTHSANSVIQCLPCPRGAALAALARSNSYSIAGANCTAPGLQESELAAADGYWRDGNSTMFAQCLRPSQCTGGATSGNCPGNRAGVLCAICQVSLLLRRAGSLSLLYAEWIRCFQLRRHVQQVSLTVFECRHLRCRRRHLHHLVRCRLLLCSPAACRPGWPLSSTSYREAVTQLIAWSWRRQS